MRRFLLCFLVSGCSLTPIPDVSSQWSEPCEPALRVCATEFTLKAGAETTVELRGSFRSDGWVKGEAMKKVGDAWTATVAVPWAASVQYKFFVDGKTWVLDPANPKTGVTAGVTNSLVDNVTCAKWVCQAHRG